MKPRFWTYTLQILQAQLSGFQDLILALNSSKLFEFLMLSGISAHVFGPRNETVFRTVKYRMDVFCLANILIT